MSEYREKLYANKIYYYYIIMGAIPECGSALTPRGRFDRNLCEAPDWPVSGFSDGAVAARRGVNKHDSGREEK